jgi:hypothetical protein
MVDSAAYQILYTGSLVNVPAANIFINVADQEGLTNYVVIHLIDVVPENTKDGVSLLDSCRIQVNCYHQTKDLVNALADEIRSKLDRYRGTVGTFTIDKIVFSDAHSDFDEERKIYIVTQDFIIRHKRP